MNNLNELISRLDEFALANYDVDGWDFWVETYEMEDKIEALNGKTSFRAARHQVLKELKLFDERRKEHQPKRQGGNGLFDEFYPNGQAPKQDFAPAGMSNDYYRMAASQGLYSI